MKEHCSQPRVILGSASPRRRELLQLLLTDFDCRVAGIDEREDGDSSPLELVCRLSRDKGVNVAKQVESSIIISSDTIVVLDNQVLGKPTDAEDALVMLRALRDRDHHVISALTIINQIATTELTDYVDTRVTMRDYTEEEIRAYIATGDPMDKAGAYAIQHPEFHPVADIQGCYAGVMGFPLCHLFRHLSRTDGIEVSHPVASCREFTGYPCTFHPQALSAAGRLEQSE